MAATSGGPPPVDVAGVNGVETERDENVFQVLARQARTRTASQLRMTVVGGLVNAGLLWWEYPALSWLVAGCLAMAAYGGWGLLDRAAHAAAQASGARMATAGLTHRSVARLAALRGLVAALGSAAALWAVGGFMAAALGNWQH